MRSSDACPYDSSRSILKTKRFKSSYNTKPARHPRTRSTNPFEKDAAPDNQRMLIATIGTHFPTLCQPQTRPSMEFAKQLRLTGERRSTKVQNVNSNPRTNTSCPTPKLARRR
jgi:hypothetical protein